MDDDFVNVEIKLPRIGYGTYEVFDADSVARAIDNGYRLIDTASHYDNEEIVGEGIRLSGIERNEIFITSKLWYSNMGYESALSSYQESLERLKVDYLDTYLIHWPAEEKKYPDWKNTNKETWRAFEHLYFNERVKMIGVCNFMEKHLIPLLEECNIIPMLNQIEVHPGFRNFQTVDFCKKNGIEIEAWQPLGGGEILKNDKLCQLAEKYNKTPAQICLRWCVQQSIIPIPKTIQDKRMKENIEIFDFVLDDNDMIEIDNIPFCGGEGASVN